MKKIILMGNPNVGKSAIFSRLTGVHAVISNYPGTSVEFTQGCLKHEDEESLVIDVPGTYTLRPTCKAEEVAVDMLRDGDVLLNIVDATNLERNLNLTLQLIEKKIPMIVVLNMWDETHHNGIHIDVPKLEGILGVPVVTACGLSGEGIHDLVHCLKRAGVSTLAAQSDDARWQRVGEIVNAAQHLAHRHHTFLETLEDISIKPWWGALVAIVVLFLSFILIRMVGEGLITWVFEPFFETIWFPLMTKLGASLALQGFAHHILIGRLADGVIAPYASFGVLTTGLFIPFAIVLPYIVSFYLVLGLLEDWGYLPRLATLMDTVMHRLGLHGYAIIPMLLGMGCNVPGILATRILEVRREKFIAAALTSIAIPCLAQTAMIVALLGRRGGRYVLFVFLILFFVWLVLGRILHRFTKGVSPELIIEIPPYRVPQLRAVFKKLFMRVRAFIIDAVPFMLGGVLFVGTLSYFNATEGLNRSLTPLFKHVWGLPAESVPAFLIGFLKKDIAVGMLAPLSLTTKQLLIGCTVLALYFPCMATFFVLMRELGIKDMLKIMILMIGISFVVGGCLNLWLPNF